VEEWAGKRFTLDGVEFVTHWTRASAPGSFTIVKPVEMVEVYRDLLARFPEPRIVELGIYQGGSVALIALLAKPRTLVAVELEETPVEPLLELIRDRGLERVVRPHFGVDQADTARLTGIVDDELGGEPIDLVIDDASHLYEPTVASFEVLFPRLRPGGAYVIEDWTAQDVLARAKSLALQGPASPLHDRIREDLAELPRTAPISRLALELALACAQSGGAVEDVVMNKAWLMVRRGEGELDPTSFRLSDLYEDHHRLLKH
jgi:predicted O-methyltransferase YrrM